MGNQTDNFSNCFTHLTGNPPFPWQATLHERFLIGDFPSSCDLPTGLGKTSVIAVWLIALAAAPGSVPRRLAYVVNRRTVVDQTTAEVERIREALHSKEELRGLRGKIGDLAISTLRGQFADNREWSADPSRPAVIVGTVDMIGSRLLFSGYGASYRTRPLYAGLLGQDTLLVHDEAHLEPAFQKLIEDIQNEQKREPAPFGESFRLKVMAMTATARSDDDSRIKLADADLANKEVSKRINAKKALQLIPNEDSKKLPDRIADFARERFETSGRAIVIFLRKVEDAERIAKQLGESARPLTGTLRGYERDEFARKNSIFARFDPNTELKEPAAGTVYLISTSAGEVGVNISADHLVCDLSTFDSMAQRFGRVNRFGMRDDSEVHVFHPPKFDEKEDVDLRMRNSLALLRELNDDASPRAISDLKTKKGIEAFMAAFAPPPVTLSTSDILFDAWAMTSIKEELPGRPKVEPYLHGLRESDPPQTFVAWRDEVEKLNENVADVNFLESLLEDYPLKPQELLRDMTDRVFKRIAERAQKFPQALFWLVDDDGRIKRQPMSALLDSGAKRTLENQTIILAPSVGGLRNGMLDGSSDAPVRDVADELSDDRGLRRVRVAEKSDPRAAGMRLVREIDLNAHDDDENAEPEMWYWFERPAGGDTDGSKSAAEPILWDHHTSDVVANVRKFTANISVSVELKDAVVIAARFHDLGKQRDHWQRSIGNPNSAPPWYAKSGKGWRPRQIGSSYRHEFGSLLDIVEHQDFKRLADKPELQNLILHLVAAHHGFARPHFPSECALDPARPTEAADTMAMQVPQRFARLQRRIGRWGLAYLESILRAADYDASGHPSKVEGAQ